MSKTIRIILLEDMRSDADIIQRELKALTFPFEVNWVQQPEQYKLALTHDRPDIVISDHSLRGFSSTDAFHWLRESGLDIPFVLVTATVSEEFAVMMMKEGIADYLLKDRLQRLPLAVTNALEKWQTEREKQLSLDMLFQNEKRFRGLIENSYDMKVVTDQNFKLVYASPALTRITGRTPEEVRDGGIDHVHPDDRKEYYNVLNSARTAPGKYLPLLYRLLHQNGAYIWLEGTAINMLDDDAISGILLNLHDVTDRKETEELLKRYQAHIAAVIENSNVSIYAIDRQFKYISFNSHLKNQLKQGYGLDIKVGDPVFDFLALLDPTELEGWRKRYTEGFTGKRVEFEKEFHIGDQFACISFSINPIIEEHYVTGLSCFAWDVTSQRQAARKIARSEARFRAMIENNYDAIIMRDEHLKVLYASPSVARMLGYSSQDLEVDIMSGMVHPDDVNNIQQIFKKVLANPDVAFGLELRLRKKNGTYIWTEGTIKNMLRNEYVKGLVSNFRDITERKESELQRERIAFDLTERNNKLEQYAYIVSHNIRGPVANILGISNLLEMDGASIKDKQESLGHLFNSVRSLDQVIKDLNVILQVQQTINEQKDKVILNDLVDDIQASINDVLRSSGVDISTDFKVTTISTVRSYIYSVFYNLITNSIKYRKEGVRPVIRITSERSDDCTRIRFIDNGMGIDLDRHGSSIFGLYKRFHIGHAEGKGIGLFMTKAQVEALGGRISIKSQVNIGTEFLIEL
jgi:PAS domain S-box-containing protein